MKSNGKFDSPYASAITIMLRYQLHFYLRFHETCKRDI